MCVLPAAFCTLEIGLRFDGMIFHQNDGTSSENVVMYSSLKEYRISFQIKYIDIKQKMQAI